MTQTTDQERAEFERTIGVDYDLTPSTIRQGQYAVPVTQAAWYGWQAARSAQTFNDDQLTKLIYEFEVAIDVARHSSDVASPDAEADEKAVNIARSKLKAHMGSRAPAVPVPQGWQLVPIEPTQEMQDAMHTTGHAPTRYAAMLAAAPQPPEADHIPDAGKMVAAPVQLPEPVAIITDTVPREPWWKTMFVPDSGTRLYTEHQVITILAQHGIKTK